MSPCANEQVNTKIEGSSMYTSNEGEVNEEESRNRQLLEVEFIYFSLVKGFLTARTTSFL